MNRFFSVKLLLTIVMIASWANAWGGGALLDDIAAVAVIAHANGKAMYCVDELQKMLAANMHPGAELVEAAFDELADCLATCKEQCAPDDFERLLRSLEERYAELTSPDGVTTKSSIKRFSNVIVHQTLSAGTVFVSGDETIGNNLTVYGNEEIFGNLTVKGSIITGTGSSSGGITLLTGDAGHASGSTVYIAGGSNINTVGNDASTVTINLDPSVTLSGSLTAGTTITAGTGITATTGNITASAGNIILPVANSAGTQGLLELGGASTTSNVSLYEFGTRNLFGGNYATPNTAVTGTDNVSFGSSANSTLTSANNTVAIGSSNGSLLGAQATATGAVALGGTDGTSGGASATGSDAVAICAGALANAGFSVAIGNLAHAMGMNAIAIGAGSNAENIGAIGIGNDTFSLGIDSVAIGYHTMAEDYGVAIGYGATAGDLSIALGSIETHTSCYIAGIRGVTTDNNDAIAVLIDSNGQLGTVSSAMRYKDNVRDLGATSERLYDLRPVAFNYKKHSPDQVSVGLIAEEVADVMPELVVYNADGMIETVKYHDLVPHLLNEMQHHQQVLAGLRAEIALLKTALNILQ